MTGRMEKSLYFLRNFPAWIPLLCLFFVLIFLFNKTGDLAYKDWASLSLASLFTALGIQRASSNSPETQPTQVTAGTVKADIKTDSISIAGDSSLSNNSPSDESLNDIKTDGQSDTGLVDKPIDEKN